MDQPLHLQQDLHLFLYPVRNIKMDVMLKNYVSYTFPVQDKLKENNQVIIQ